MRATVVFARTRVTDQDGVELEGIEHVAAGFTVVAH